MLRLNLLKKNDYLNFAEREGKGHSPSEPSASGHSPARAAGYLRHAPARAHKPYDH